MMIHQRNNIIYFRCELRSVKIQSDNTILLEKKVDRIVLMSTLHRAKQRREIYPKGFITNINNKKLHVSKYLNTNIYEYYVKDSSISDCQTLEIAGSSLILAGIILVRIAQKVAIVPCKLKISLSNGGHIFMTSKTTSNF